MFFSVDTFMEAPFSVVPSSADESVPNPARALLADLDAEFVFVLIGQPLDLLGSSSIGSPYPLMSYAMMSIPASDDVEAPFIYLSDKWFQTPPNVQITGFEKRLLEDGTNRLLEDGTERLLEEPITVAGDTTIPNQNFSPRLLKAFNYETSVPLPGADRSGGRTTIGNIVIANIDGELDSYANKTWNGRNIEIKAGGTFNVGKANETTLTFNEMVTIFKGIAENISWDQDKVDITIRDPGAMFEKPVQETLYIGTGGLEGGVNLKSQPKPLMWGKVTNINVPLVDSANLIYQLHDGAFEAVDAVRDNGVALTFDADVGDITTATPASGEYATSLATGFIKLGASPDGLITCDAQGHKTPTYVDKAAEILRRIATTIGGLIDPDEIDAVSFADTNTDAPEVVGYWATYERQVNMAEIFDEIMLSADGWWTFRRDALLAVGIHKDASMEISIKTFDEDIIKDGSVERRDTPNPVWRYRLGYKKRWAVQNEDSLGGAVSDDDKFLYSHEHSFVTLDNVSTKSIFKLARNLEINTLLNASADADSQVLKRLARDKKSRDLYKFTCSRCNFQEKIGTVNTLTLNRFGLDNGRQYSIVGIVENTLDKTVEIEVYG